MINYNKPINMNFTLNEKEQEAYNKFIKKHKSCEFPSTIGGKISLTFTGILFPLLSRTNAPVPKDI